MTVRGEDGVLIERYFAEVADALRPLSAEGRAEILADLRTHLEQRRREGGAPVQAILAELGRPEDIAAQAGLGLPRWPLPAPPPRDTWSLAAIVLTVFVWPVGLVIAAVSGRWRLRSLVYAGITPLFGWAMGLGVVMAAPVASASMSSPGATTCLDLHPVAASPVPPPTLRCAGVPTVVPWVQLHPFLHALGTGGAIGAAIVGLVGGPLVAAAYLAQTDGNPGARPWLPVTTLGVIAVGLLLAHQFVA